MTGIFIFLVGLTLNELAKLILQRDSKVVLYDSNLHASITKKIRGTGSLHQEYFLKYCLIFSCFLESISVG